MNNYGQNGGGQIPPMPPPNFQPPVRTFLGTTWAIFWRAFLPYSIIVGIEHYYILVLLSFLATWLMRLNGFELHPDPIRRIFKLQSPAYRRADWVAKHPDYQPWPQPYQAPPKPEPVQTPAQDSVILPPPLPTQKKATRRGEVSDFEPRYLEKMPIPRGAKMHGIPGHGLTESGFDENRVDAGILGEVNLAKALAYSSFAGWHGDNSEFGFLDRVPTFFSLRRPSLSLLDEKVRYKHVVEAQSESGADIDCVVLCADTLYLIDAKMYRGGDLTYTKAPGGDYIICIDNVTGNAVGEPIKMSRNMEIAAATMQKKFFDKRVVPLVVVMPSNMGQAKIAPGLKFPGGVEVITPDELLCRLDSEENPMHHCMPEDEVAIQKLIEMLK